MQLTPIKIKERKNLDIRSGDTVKIWQKIEEGKKTRSQAFEGIIVSKKHGSEIGATFTLRKKSGKTGVELTIPLYSPKVEKIELISRPKRVRRAKLYYIRERAARAIKKKMRQSKQIHEVVMEEVDSTSSPRVDEKPVDDTSAEEISAEKENTKKETETTEEKKEPVEKPKETEDKEKDKKKK